MEGAQGMFLWVVLQIEYLCAERTDEAIRQALVDLPKDLSETFSRILRRTKVFEDNYQRRILELIVVARRPLITEELREALSVVPGDTTWNPSRLLNDLHSTLACCGSLVIIDEEEWTVRLVHHRVKKFLLAGSEDIVSLPSGIPFTEYSADRKMAEIIVTYLNYNIFHTQLSVTVVPQMSIGSVPCKVIRSALGPLGNARNLALKLLKSRRQPGCDIGNTVNALSNPKNHVTPRTMSGFWFSSYAKSHWIEHAWRLPKQEMVLNKRLVQLLRNAIIDLKAKDEHGWTVFTWAVRHNDEAVVKQLLETGKVDLESTNPCGETSVLQAAREGAEAIVKLLLETGKVNINAMDESGHTPFSHATRNGYRNIVKLLLETSKLNVELKTRDNETPLLLASKNGHEAVVKLLLDTGKFHIEVRDINGESPLSWARKNGHEAVVVLLYSYPMVCGWPAKKPGVSIKS
jgi:ankyrin repeat protein